MELTKQQLEFMTKFVYDNVIDGARDNSLIMWPALDVATSQEVFILGRRVKEDKVLPVAILICDSLAAVKRYAPRKGLREDYDFSMIESRIIRPT
jgi:hypothetical protein